MMYRVVGFSGTQEGVTRRQGKLLIKIMQIINPRKGQHGDCIGADAFVHKVWRKMGCRITIRPPINESKRAFCKGANTTMPPKIYPDRNKDIVNTSDVLVATPRTSEEELRSGTWSTIRYARKQGKPIIIIGPDGKFRTENLKLNKAMERIK